MQEQNKKFKSERVTTSNFWKRRTTYTTAYNSPNKADKLFLSRTSSLDRSLKTDHSAQFNKKSVHQVKYFLQMHKKRARNAQILKSFQQSNISPQLSHKNNNKGMKGGKLQNHKIFRKNKFVQFQQFGCVEPLQCAQKSNCGLIVRHSKPNFMYNLDLFRKRKSKEDHQKYKRQKNQLFLKNQPKVRYNSFTGKRGRTLRTQQDFSKLHTFTQRQEC